MNIQLLCSILLNKKNTKTALFLIFMAFLPPAVNAASDKVAVVILVDGLAPALVKAAPTPTLDRLEAEGVRSDHLIPVYPTVSMSNHTSFTTGCWPKNHGIMSNRFIDPVKGLYDNSLDADWRTGCESLFEAAERQGVTSAAMGITGFTSSSNGARATYVSKEMAWGEYPSDSKRADEVVALLALPAEKRPSLIVVYFLEPDHSVHYQQHKTPETKSLMTSVDASIGKIMAALEGLPEGIEKALFISADHGHKEVKEYVNIGRVMGKHDIKAEYASSGASSFLYFENASDIDSAFEALSSYDFFDVYRKGQFPDYAHVGEGERVGDLLLQAKPPYWMEDPDQFPTIAHLLGMTRIWPVAFQVPNGGLKSTHGYPPDVVEMHGAFYAWGDGLATGVTLDTLNQVDVHPTVAKWLGIEPGFPVDGAAADILIEEE